MVFAPPRPHPATSLNSASGPASESRSTVTSYVSVLPPGTSAYGLLTARRRNSRAGAATHADAAHAHALDAALQTARDPGDGVRAVDA